MSSEHPQRSEFLVSWYDVLWRNIDRSMTGMWQVLAPITVVGTGLWAVGGEYLPLWVGGPAIVFVIMWAINLTIDLNSWHRRNLYLLATVERQFLSEGDYGRLIPRRYRTPQQRWVRFYVVHGLTLGILLPLAFAYLCQIAWSRDVHCMTWFALVGALLAGLTFTGHHLRQDRRNASEMHAELFPPDLNARSTEP